MGIHIVAKKQKYKTLGEALEQARLDANMNMRMAATALAEDGVMNTPDYTSLSRFERGIRVPKLPMFIGMCRVYGVRPSEMLERCGLDEIKYELEDILAEREDWVEADPSDGENMRCMIYLPDTLREDGGDLADSRGMNFSELIRKLLREDLRKHRKRQERRAAS